MEYNYREFINGYLHLTRSNKKIWLMEEIQSFFEFFIRIKTQKKQHTCMYLTEHNKCPLMIMNELFHYSLITKGLYRHLLFQLPADCCYVITEYLDPESRAQLLHALLPIRNVGASFILKKFEMHQQPGGIYNVTSGKYCFSAGLHVTTLKFSAARENYDKNQFRSSCFNFKKSLNTNIHTLHIERPLKYAEVELLKWTCAKGMKKIKFEMSNDDFFQNPHVWINIMNYFRYVRSFEFEEIPTVYSSNTEQCLWMSNKEYCKISPNVSFVTITQTARALKGKHNLLTYFSTSKTVSELKVKVLRSYQLIKKSIYMKEFCNLRTLRLELHNIKYLGLFKIKNNTIENFEVNLVRPCSFSGNKVWKCLMNFPNLQGLQIKGFAHLENISEIIEYTSSTCLSEIEILDYCFSEENTLKLKPRCLSHLRHLDLQLHGLQQIQGLENSKLVTLSLFNCYRFNGMKSLYTLSCLRVLNLGLLHVSRLSIIDFDKLPASLTFLGLSGCTGVTVNFLERRVLCHFQRKTCKIDLSCSVAKSEIKYLQSKYLCEIQGA